MKLGRKPRLPVLGDVVIEVGFQKISFRILEYLIVPELKFNEHLKSWGDVKEAIVDVPGAQVVFRLVRLLSHGLCAKKEEQNNG